MASNKLALLVKNEAMKGGTVRKEARGLDSHFYQSRFADLAKAS